MAAEEDNESLRAQLKSEYDDIEKSLPLVRTRTSRWPIFSGRWRPFSKPDESEPRFDESELKSKLSKLYNILIRATQLKPPYKGLINLIAERLSQYVLEVKPYLQDEWLKHIKEEEFWKAYEKFPEFFKFSRVHEEFIKQQAKLYYELVKGLTEDNYEKSSNLILKMFSDDNVIGLDEVLLELAKADLDDYNKVFFPVNNKPVVNLYRKMLDKRCLSYGSTAYRHIDYVRRHSDDCQLLQRSFYPLSNFDVSDMEALQSLVKESNVDKQSPMFRIINEIKKAGLSKDNYKRIAFTDDELNFFKVAAEFNNKNGLYQKLEKEMGAQKRTEHQTASANQGVLIVAGADFDDCTADLTDEQIPESLTKADFLYLSSNRQDERLNILNSKTREAAKTRGFLYNAFYVMPFFAEKINAKFVPLLIADVENHLEPGTALRKNSKYTAKSEDLKIKILLAQMWHAKMTHGQEGKAMNFDFYDDREDILYVLDIFFKSNKHLIPTNVTLRLHQLVPKKNQYNIINTGIKGEGGEILNAEGSMTYDDDSENTLVDDGMLRLDNFLNDKLKNMDKYKKFRRSIDFILKTFKDALQDELRDQDPDFLKYRKQNKEIYITALEEIMKKINIDILTDKDYEYIKQLRDDFQLKPRQARGETDFKIHDFDKEYFNRLATLLHVDIKLDLNLPDPSPSAAASSSSQPAVTTPVAAASSYGDMQQAFNASKSIRNESNKKEFSHVDDAAAGRSSDEHVAARSSDEANVAAASSDSDKTSRKDKGKGKKRQGGSSSDKTEIDTSRDDVSDWYPRGPQ